MARKYETEYRVSKVAEVLKTENAFRLSMDLRLDAIETTLAALGSDASELVARVVRAIDTEIAPRAAEIQALLDDYRAGVPAGSVQEETSGRQFLTPARRAAILAELRGGVDASGDTLAKLLALIGAVDAAKATPADIAAAIAALKGGAPAAYDTLVEIATWIANDETAEAAITAALAQRLRLDAAGGYSPAQQAQGLTNLGIVDLARGVFAKSDPRSVAFTRTGNSTLRTATPIVVELGGRLHTIPANTLVQMPTLVAGTDYALYPCEDEVLRADASFTAPAGYAGLSRQVGGFHFAPGGNATANAGGDATAQINPFSIWDLKFRPTCDDPRGMALIDGWFWAAIYLLGVNHIADGASRYNVVIADGSSPPKIPLTRGGNGTTTYSTLTRWEAAEVLGSHGLRLPSVDEFQALAFGSTENASFGTDPGSTVLRQAYTSRWGIMLATGNMWVWGLDFGGGAAAAGWVNNNGGRGQTYQQENAVILGGNWVDAADAGSRAAFWNYSPSASYGNIGARGCCDHLCHV